MNKKPTNRVPQRKVHGSHSTHFNIPADWKVALNHSKARETKPEKDVPQGQYLETCPCCGFEIEREPIKLSISNIDLGFLGAGFPMFYNYIIYCCVMLFCLFIIQGIPNIVFNSTGNFCNKTLIQAFQINQKQHHNPKGDVVDACPMGFSNKISIANTLNKLKETGGGFHFSTLAMIVQLVLMILFRKSQKEIEMEVDQTNITPADYTVWIKNIPLQIQNVQQQLYDLFQSKGINVSKINLVYDISEVEHIESWIKREIAKKQEMLKQNSLNLQDPGVLAVDKEIYRLKEELQKKEEAIQNDHTKFAGSAFVSFLTENEKQKVVKENEIGVFPKFKNYFNGGRSQKYCEALYLVDRHLYIEEAPEPNDVDWEFAHVSTSDKLKARGISLLKWLAVSLISFAVICLISYFSSLKVDHVIESLLEIQKKKKKNKKDNDKEAQINSSLAWIGFFSFLISSSIVLFNKFLLPFLIHHIVEAEKWSTKTKLNISFAIKLTVSLFFNTSLITILIEVILFKNFYGIGGGMIYSEELVFIFNAIIPSLAWVIDPWTILKNMKRNKELVNKEKSVLTQYEANQQ